MRYYFRLVYAFLGIFLLEIVQVSVFSAFPLLQQLNIVLVAFIFIAFIIPRQQSALIAVMCGIVTDIYTYLSFGTHIFIYLAIWLIFMLLYENIFSTISLYPVVLMTTLLSASYMILVFGASYFPALFNGSVAPIQLNSLFFTNTALFIISNCIAITIVYGGARLISRKVNFAFIR